MRGRKRKGRREGPGPEMTRRRCNNPGCGKWYDVEAALVRKGEGLYCNRWCGWQSKSKYKWFECLQCGRHFRRPKKVWKHRACKFCRAECYRVHRLGIKRLEDWRTFPLDDPPVLPEGY